MFESFNTEFPHMIGGDRLAYINVYYDFDWAQVFGHRRATFPNGKCLSMRVKKECPEGKVPALILTTRDDAEVMPIENDTHYAVVVKIKDYLNSPSFDPSANYFASASQIQLTKSRFIKQVMDRPELVTKIVESGLTIEMINRWAIGGGTERWLQLKQLVRSTAIESEDEEGKAQIPAKLDSAIDLLKWFAQEDNLEPLLAKLKEMGIDDLNKIISIVGVVNLRKILKLWDDQKQNSAEDYWQDIFKSNPWVISQVFAYPVVIITDKAYVGGKAVDNTGGNIVDFLYQNQITANVMLVEIKTPTTKLLSSQYREKIFSISPYLTGAINQILNYKEEMQKSFYALSGASTDRYTVINPKCLLITGSFENERLDDTQKKSFEIFRSDLKSVEIITYDELFAKMRLLLALLEGFDTDK